MGINTQRFETRDTTYSDVYLCLYPHIIMQTRWVENFPRHPSDRGGGFSGTQPPGMWDPRKIRVIDKRVVCRSALIAALDHIAVR